MKVVDLNKGSKDELLGLLDSIRKSIEDGEIQGFAGVGIEDGDETRYYTAATKSISRLRFVGAAECLKIWIQTTDF